MVACVDGGVIHINAHHMYIACPIYKLKVASALLLHVLQSQSGGRVMISAHAGQQLHLPNSQHGLPLQLPDELASQRGSMYSPRSVQDLPALPAAPTAADYDVSTLIM